MRGSLIRLGSAQLAILCAGLLHIVFTAYVFDQPLWDDAYARAFLLPHLEERWGFRYGTFRVQYGGGKPEYKGIVSLTRGGRLARLGVRTHDMPGRFGHHSPPSIVVLCEALLAAERGEDATLRVANIDDWAAGRMDVIRDIKLPPGQ